MYAPGEDYPLEAGDHELLEWALRLGCVVVSMDRFFEGKPGAVYVEPEWERRLNSWDLTTRVIKHAARIRGAAPPHHA